MVTIVHTASQVFVPLTWKQYKSWGKVECLELELPWPMLKHPMLKEKLRACIHKNYKVCGLDGSIIKLQLFLCIPQDIVYGMQQIVYKYTNINNNRLNYCSNG